MCKCTPRIKTPFCGRPGCEWPGGVMPNMTPDRVASNTLAEQSRPSVLFRPTLSQDGNKWRALYGDNITTGVTGVGDTPDDAMRNFDERWIESLTNQ